MTPTSVLYHYCAIHQPRAGVGSFNLSDGTIQTKEDPGTKTGWDAIRASIAGRFVPAVTPEAITILSFTRLSP